MSITSNTPVSVARSGLFGNKSPASAPAADDRPKAQFWINVGYAVEVQVSGPDGKTVQEQRFVSMPIGIPVDTQEELKTNTRNVEWNMLQQARNELVHALTEAGNELEPGEERIVNLQVQLRRVKDEAAAPDITANPFLRAEHKL
jgi:hypothetical protein